MGIRRIARFIKLMAVLAAGLAALAARGMRPPQDGAAAAAQEAPSNAGGERGTAGLCPIGEGGAERMEIPQWDGAHPCAYRDADGGWTYCEAGAAAGVLWALEGYASAEGLSRLKEEASGGALYSPYDALGRAGRAAAYLCADKTPDGERGSLGDIKPSGWRQAKYPDLIGNPGYLFNRCHLIGWRLCGDLIAETANAGYGGADGRLSDDGLCDVGVNLVTGTRYMNVEGMLPYEDLTAALLREGYEGAYAASPIYVGDEPLCRGVVLEAYFPEADTSFCAFCFNVQPGVEIDYSNGASRVA